MSWTSAHEHAFNLRHLHQEMHDLSQPLTRLQWRLEIGQSGRGEHELRETIEGALADMQELMESIHRLRHKIEDAQGRAA